jgi:DNA-binding CsgD family transcriptional regulator
LNFQYNPALGYFAVVMIIIALFILTLRFRFWLLFISAAVMCAVVVSQPDLTYLETRFWLIAIINTTILTLVLSNVWYNNFARQFMIEKALETQKKLLTEQADRLAKQNDIIEHDKSLLAQQLDSSQRQLNAFALRLAKSGNLLESIKADLADIKVTEAEEASKQKQLLRKIANANTRESDWALFREQFEQVYPDFIPTLLKQFPSLNSGELRLLSLLKMNLETQEIASIIGISVQSLHTARYRLRKHLGLNTDEGLFEFVQRYK